MPDVFLNDWTGYSTAELELVFGLAPGALDNLHIILASYSATEQSGYAFIVYLDAKNQLFEINASHDSILDFDGQWLPEDTTVEALMFRMEKGALGRDDTGNNVFASELKQALISLIHSDTPLQ